MKNLGKKILKYIILAVVVFLVTVLIATYINEDRFAFSARYASSVWPFLAIFVVVGLMIVFDLMKLADGKGAKKPSKAIDQAKDEKGRNVNEYYSRDFVPEEDLKSNKAFNYNTLSTIRSCKTDGILVRAEDKKFGMEINFVKPIHSLIVGTTSSGKTSRFVIPSLQIMSMTAAKPSFVITDPKGELYEKCSSKFKSEGYDVKIINLRDPFTSVQWNPLTYPYDVYHRSFTLDKEVKVHPPGDNPKSANLMIQRPFDHTTTTWFEFNHTAYADKDRLESDMRVIARQLKDDAFSSLKDIVSTLAPIESGKDPSWEQTAQRVIHATMLAMLEDSMIPELGMTREKFNLYNIYKAINTNDSGRDTFASLKKYLFNYRDKFSQVPELANAALNNAEVTSKNYMGFASSKMALFSDTGICFLTSNSEIDFTIIDETPTALFIIIPDEIYNRYPLAVLFINQLYKRLVDKAQDLGGELKRHVYFMLEEFGNMPKFPDFGKSMAVGRSRGIYFELIVQSYSQLYQVYGQEEGKSIKDNCPINVYVASEDMQTNKEFSELLGKKTIVKTTENKSVGPDGKESTSYSPQTVSRPIAFPEELMSFRDEGKLVIKTFEPNAALKTTITPYFASKAKCYDLSRVYGSYVQRRMFNEEVVFYDIKTRNDRMAKLNNNDDDDDDDLF